jgi:hypothetical protein
MWNIPTREQLARLPGLYETDHIDCKDKIIHLHFFMGSFDWWLAEFDGEDTFFGFACLGDPDMAEWGFIPFHELKELKMDVPLRSMKPDEEIGKIPLEVDCDKFWTPKKFSEVWPRKF